MKIAPRDLNQFVKNPPAHFCGAILYGPNGPQIAQMANDIAKTIVADLHDPFNVTTLSASDLTGNPTLIADELFSQSLMGGRRLIRLKNAGDKTTTAIKNAIENAQDCPNFLLIEASALSTRSSLRKLGESAKNMAILACYEDDERSLSIYIQHALTVAGLHPDRDVAPFLSHQLFGNRALADRMIEKIKTYKGEDTVVTFDDAKNCAGDPSETSIDIAIQAALDGRQSQLDEALEILWGEGVSPIALVRVAQGQLYRLRKVQTAIHQGVSTEEAIKKLRPPLFFKAKPAFTQQLRRWTIPKIDKALASLLRLEVQCKKTGTPTLPLTHRLLASLAA